MAISLYMDVHIPQAITDQLRRRGVDVLTAQAAESGTYPILWDGICRTNDYPESTCDHDRIRIESVYEKIFAN